MVSFWIYNNSSVALSFKVLQMSRSCYVRPCYQMGVSFPYRSVDNNIPKTTFTMQLSAASRYFITLCILRSHKNVQYNEHNLKIVTSCQYEERMIRAQCFSTILLISYVTIKINTQAAIVVKTPNQSLLEQSEV